MTTKIRAAMLSTLTSLPQKELGRDRTDCYKSVNMEMNMSAAVSLDPLLDVSYVKLHIG